MENFISREHFRNAKYGEDFGHEPKKVIKTVIFEIDKSEENKSMISCIVASKCADSKHGLKSCPRPLEKKVRSISVEKI